MTGLSLLLVVGVLPVHTAHTVPPGTTVVHVGGGFSIVGIGLPVAPAIPVLTGDAELIHGLADGLDVRARYTTHLGVVHRLGPELRLRLSDPEAEDGAVGIRLYTSASLAGAAQDSVEFGGDVQSQLSLLLTFSTGLGFLTAEAGFSTQWILFESLEDGSFVDTDPFLASADFALELEWSTSPTSNLSLRAEILVPSDADDPFTVLGVQPRLLFGGNFAL